jgi:hypothetical protein
MPSQTSNDGTPDLGVLWGAIEIGLFISIPEEEIRKVYHLLETGALDADKVGGIWTSTRARLTRQSATPRAERPELTNTTEPPNNTPPDTNSDTTEAEAPPTPRPARAARSGRSAPRRAARSARR